VVVEARSGKERREADGEHPGRDMARRRGGAAAAAVASPAVVGAISTMALVYYSTIFVFLDHWLGLATPAGAAHAAAVSLAVAACFLAFVRAAAADPGAAPTAFPPTPKPRRDRSGNTEISRFSFASVCWMFVFSFLLFLLVFSRSKIRMPLKMRNCEHFFYKLLNSLFLFLELSNFYIS
jgi:hypothetical protein